MKRWMRNAAAECGRWASLQMRRAPWRARLAGKAAGISRQRERRHPPRSAFGARKIGVDFAQGHHMARPRPLAELGS